MLSCALQPFLTLSYLKTQKINIRKIIDDMLQIILPSFCLYSFWLSALGRVYFSQYPISLQYHNLKEITVYQQYILDAFIVQESYGLGIKKGNFNDFLIIEQ